MYVNHTFMCKPRHTQLLRNMLILPASAWKLKVGNIVTSAFSAIVGIKCSFSH